MHRITFVALAVPAMGFAAPLLASDHTGIYASIEEVTLTNLRAAEARIQIRGVFALAKGRRDYHPPRHGYMYFRLREDQAKICLKEWGDLESVAGSGAIVAFGRRYGPKGPQAGVAPLGRVRGLNEDPANPDVYPLNFGVRKIRQSPGYPATDGLAYYATPATPAEGATVEAGPVRLSANKALAKDDTLKYFFEIQAKDGKKLTSAAISGGNGQATWTPDLKIQAGGKYTWRVWTVTRRPRSGTKTADGRKGPVATAHFRGKQAE